MAFRLGLNILAHRIQDRLRFELGLAYEVETIFVPLNAERVHVVIVSDATEQNVRRVTEEALRTIEELAGDGPSEEELEDELFQARRQYSNASELHSQLFYAAAQHLVGAEPETAASLLATHESLTSEDVARSLEAARASLLAIVPELDVDLPGLSPYPASSSTPIEGRRFRPPGLRLRSGGLPELVVGADGAARHTWASSAPRRGSTSPSPSCGTRTGRGCS